MSLVKLARLVAKAPSKTELRIHVTGGGGQVIALETVKGDVRKPIVIEHHAGADVVTLDGMAEYTIEQLAAKALGIEGYA